MVPHMGGIRRLRAKSATVRLLTQSARLIVATSHTVSNMVPFLGAACVTWKSSWLRGSCGF